MQVWDLTSAGPVLIMSRIAGAGPVISEMLLGVRIARAPFLLLLGAVRTVQKVFSTPGNTFGRKKALLCRTLQ